VDARGANEQAERAVTAAEEAKQAYYGPDLPVGFDFYPAAHEEECRRRKAQREHSTRVTIVQ
jgi:hypothetical protein